MAGVLTPPEALPEETVGRPAARMVLTHGEPHPGNTMRTVDGWRLIDWDTALVAHRSGTCGIWSRATDRSRRRTYP